MSDDRPFQHAKDAYEASTRTDDPVLKRVLLGLAGSWLEIAERARRGRKARRLAQDED